MAIYQKLEETTASPKQGFWGKLKTVVEAIRLIRHGTAGFVVIRKDRSGSITIVEHATLISIDRKL